MSPSNNSKKAKKKSSKLPIPTLLKKITADELKDFVVHYCKKSNSFRADFELYFAEKDEDFDIEVRYREQIRKTIKAHTYRPAVIEQKISAIEQKIKQDKQRLGWSRQDYLRLFELGPIYVQEQLLERLLELVQKQDNIDAILSYHANLYETYPDELMALYDARLDQVAESARDRKRLS